MGECYEELCFHYCDEYCRGDALFGAGSQKMNNLTTSIPAILCIIAAILAIIQLKRGMDK